MTTHQKKKEGFNMAENELLKAIQTMLKEEIRASEERTAQKVEGSIKASEERTAQKIEATSKDTIHQAQVLMDSYFEPKFNLIAENQQIIMEKLETLDEMEIMDTRITALEAMVKKMNRDLKELKKAQ